MQSFDVDNTGLLHDSSAAAACRPGGGGAEAEQDSFFLAAAAKSSHSRSQHRRWLIAATTVAVCSLLLAVAALAVAAAGAWDRSTSSTSSISATVGSTKQQLAAWPTPIRSIAFSSCTSYDVRPQPIWTQGVIPANPDAWLWLGDIAYFDDPLINCNLVPDFPQCNCTADWMRRPPFQCFAGVAEHARLRMQLQLGIREYTQFLSHMCPGYQATGVFPPLGTDPSMCPRPIFGVYDDHDSGWNNGNTRNPAKNTIKQIFLDGIGEAPDSHRRSNSNGIQVSYTLPGPSAASSSSTLNKHGLRDEIQLVLLDQRYFRESLPCSVREAWCRRVLSQAASSSAGDVAWCRDYLGDGTPGNPGSCCRKDDEWDAWCSQAGASQHPHWSELCDATSASFAQRPLILSTDNQTVLDLTDGLWDDQQPQLWHRLLEGSSSPICDVLGIQQRQWLQQQLQGSKAALTVIASGSVLAGSLGWQGPDNLTCSGDDLACWPRAQVNLLHTIANASGCTVVLTGDYHYSDLKVIRPGADTAYAGALQTARLRKPVYQAMASGMTWSTAEHQASPCRGSFREDLVGLRPGGACSYVREPAFGSLEVKWERRVVSLSVRNHTRGSAVAAGVDGSRQELRFDLDTCELL